MIREFIYLFEGIEKRVGEKVESLINEGKDIYGDDDLITIGKKHLDKRKKQLKHFLLSDFKDVADEVGIATKKDIENLKDYIKDKNAD